MDVLRISTAGSVDDGKSTLIGRLLYETKSIPTDKLASIEQASKRRGLDFTDLSLLTDGLLAEREQGITIDVAHIYFSTSTRRYIIADSPGHEEYTRNMITGSSNAHVSIILVDANRDLTEQTFRHLYIASLLRIKEVIVCTNKMDLVEFSEEKFNDLKSRISRYWKTLGQKEAPLFVPTSSLKGDNISETSSNLLWYTGKPLLSVLESIRTSDSQELPTRFQVQQSLREANNQNRSFTGKIKSGRLTVGQKIQVFPSGRTSSIRSINKYKEAFSEAKSGDSVSIQLNDDIDVSRGDHLIDSAEIVKQAREISAHFCWLSEEPLNPLQQYEVQHGPANCRTKFVEIKSVISPSSLEITKSKNVSLNSLFDASIRLSKALLIDKYSENKSNGAFIIIDPGTGATVAVGFRS